MFIHDTDPVYGWSELFSGYSLLVPANTGNDVRPAIYEVEVEEPNPYFAKMLQQAIGGAESETRIALRYVF